MKKNYVLLRNNLSQYKNIFQYVYLNVYPKIYCATERRGFDLKNRFHIVFKTYKDKKRLKSCRQILRCIKIIMLKYVFLNKSP